MPVLGLDHVGILARTADDLLALAGRLGLAAEPSESHPDRGIDVVWLDAGEVLLEVIIPTDPQSRAGAALQSDGAGIHHLAFAVADVDTSLAEMREAGVALADDVPREGLRGTRIAFLEPSTADGLRIELVEHPSADRPIPYNSEYR